MKNRSMMDRALAAVVPAQTTEVRTFDQRVHWPEGFLNQTYNSFLHSSQNESTIDYMIEDDERDRQPQQFQGLN